jgi:putative flippase GtrA
MSSGISLSDTQTGLRYLPQSLLYEVSKVESDGYDFELEYLLTARKLGYTLRQLPIDTVYIRSNASSHFRPIVDSYRVYKALFHFSGASLFCFALDITLFAIFYHASANAMLATLAARTISGVVNFTINKSYVFNRKKSRRTLREGCEYFVLWLVIAVLSGSAVTLVQGNPGYIVVPFKIVVDILLFFLSFAVQRRYIFADRATP